MLKGIFSVASRCINFVAPEVKIKQNFDTMNKIKVIFIDNCVNIVFKHTHPNKSSSRIVNINPAVEAHVEKVINRIRTSLAVKKNKKKVNINNVNQTSDTVTVSLYMGSEKVLSEKQLTMESIFKAKDKYHLEVQGIKYWFDFNPPAIKSFSISSSIILTGYPICPVKVEMLNGLSDKITYSWYTSLCAHYIGEKKKLEYEKVFDGDHYTPQKKDVGKFIMVIGKVSGEDDHFGHVEYSKKFVEPGPTDLPYKKRQILTQEFTSNDSFRVVSYNLLADRYSDSILARTHLFSHCIDSVLTMYYRRHLIFDELIGYKADLLCLQEVDLHLFERDLSYFLSLNNYNGVFVPKSSCEGLAVYYKTDKFKLIENIRYSLTEELKNNPLFLKTYEIIKSNENLWTVLDNIHTAIQATVLEHESENKILLVGNTHLYFKPERDDIRLLQSEICLTLLRQLMAMYAAKNPDKTVAILFCGDFNSSPSDGVYRYMTTGYIGEDEVDWQSVPEEKMEGLSLSHNLQIESACGTPKYTTYTLNFADCIDYIYFESNKMDVTKVVPLQSHEEVTAQQALPNEKIPSDHLALVAEMKWRQ